MKNYLVITLTNEDFWSYKGILNRRADLNWEGGLCKVDLAQTIRYCKEDRERASIQLPVFFEIYEIIENLKTEFHNEVYIFNQNSSFNWQVKQCKNLCDKVKEEENSRITAYLYNHCSTLPFMIGLKDNNKDKDYNLILTLDIYLDGTVENNQECVYNNNFLSHREVPKKKLHIFGSSEKYTDERYKRLKDYFISRETSVHPTSTKIGEVCEKIIIPNSTVLVDIDRDAGRTIPKQEYKNMIRVLKNKMTNKGVKIKLISFSGNKATDTNGWYKTGLFEYTLNQLNENIKIKTKDLKQKT